ncbi:MAG: hypothetical protein ABIL52_07775 [candidate division WOR-3 bacterium]
MLELLLGYFIKVNESNISLLKIIETENSVIGIGNRLNENNIGEIVILKFSNDGNLIFSKSIYSNKYLIFSDAVYRNGKIYIIGTIPIENEGNNILFICIDTNANILISRYFSVINYESPSAITILNDKIYIIGNMNPLNNIPRMFFLITDTLGIPKFLKIAYFLVNFTNLKGFFIENNNIYVYGDYFDNKRIPFVFKFDSLFNLLEGKKFSLNTNLPILGFQKVNDSIFILFDKYLLTLRSDWKILNIKSLSNLIPKFLNYSNALEIFGIFNDKPFYYVLDRHFPILKYANISSNNLKYAKNYILFNSTTDYLFPKNLTNCDVFQYQLFYLNDINLNLTVENFPITLISFSIPFSQVSLYIKDINTSISYICPTSAIKDENFEVSYDKFYEVYKIDGTFLGKLKPKNLKKGIYILKDGKKYKKFFKLHSP